MPPARLSPVLRHIRKLVSPRSVEVQSDAQLLQSFVRQQDEAAFTALVRRHGPLVLSVCRNVLHHEQEAEDAFQATFLILARHAASIRKMEAVGSWLYRVAYRTATNAGVLMAKRRAHEGNARNRAQVEPHSEAAWREMEALIHQEVNRLPEKYRAPFVLCCLEGKNGAQAAGQLGWKEGTVRGRLTQARRLLQQRLARRGVELSAVLCAATLGGHAVRAAVPAALAASTVRAALLFGVPNTAVAGLVSPEVAALVKGATKAMFLTKLKMITVLVLAAAVLAAGTGGLVQRKLAAQPSVPSQTDSTAGRERTEDPPKQVADKPGRTDAHGDPLPPGAIARLGTIRFRHGGPIYAVAYSPDGKTLASGSYDRSLRVWDLITGRELRRCAGHQDRLSSVAYSPDGKILASGSCDKTIRLWDTSTGKQIRQFDEQDLVTCVAFSPDGRTLASGSYDKTARLWEVASGKELVQFLAHEKVVDCIAFTADGNGLVSGSRDGVIRLWELATGKEIRSFWGHRGDVRCLALSPGGKTLASGSYHKDDNSVRLWDVASGKELRKLAGHRDGVNAVLFSSDGKALISGSYDGTIRLWDASTGQEIRQLGEHQRWITSLALSPDGKTLVSGGHDNTLRLWDIVTGKELSPAGGHQGPVRSVAFSPDGETLASGSSDQTICVWDSTAGKELRRLTGHSGQVFGVALSPDGRMLASASGDALVNGKDNMVRLWDLTTGKELRQLQGHGGPVYAVAFSPDGKALASGSYDNTIRLWEVSTGKELRQLRGRQDLDNRIYTIAFSPDGKTLVSGGQGQTIRLWEVGSSRELRQFAGDQNALHSVALSPDGETIASSSGGNTIDLWWVATGRLIRRFQSKQDQVIAVVFSPDGRTLASGSKDGAITLWEIATGKERSKFQGHQGWVGSLAFSPNGRTLASGSFDTTVLTWDVTGLLQGGRHGAVKLSDKELENLWTDLASADARRGYQAMWTMAAVPKQAVPFLKQHIRPGVLADAQRIAELIAQLDSDHFEVRERARADLEKLGEMAEAGLRKALAGQPTAEVRRRLEQLIEKLSSRPITSLETLRAIRAIEVLEHCSTREAQYMLESLTKGVPEARLTQEAQAALERLNKRPASEP